jgi:hypothetical protein
VVRERSAKQLHSGSNPLAASRKFKRLAPIELASFFLDAHISVCCPEFPSTKALNSRLADSVVSLEHVHGFVAA